MARYAPAEQTGTYNVIQQWINTCLDHNGRLLNDEGVVQPNNDGNLWTDAQLNGAMAFLEQAIAENLNQAALLERIAAVDEGHAKRLLVELFFVQGLFPNTDQDARAGQMQRILPGFGQWPYNGAGTYQQAGSRAAIMKSWCTFSSTYKQPLDLPLNERLLHAFESIHPAAQGHNRWLIYNSIRHMVAPDYIERIGDNDQKDELARTGLAFLNAVHAGQENAVLRPLMDACPWCGPVDQNIWRIRRYLEQHHHGDFGLDFDWYVQDGDGWNIRPLPDAGKPQVVPNVNGQAHASPAIAVPGRPAGQHNLVLCGPPGESRTGAVAPTSAGSTSASVSTASTPRRKN